MFCLKKLTADVLFDCQTKPTKGLEKRVLIINFADIDRKETRTDHQKTLIERFVLKQHSMAYVFQGFGRSFAGSQKLNGRFQQELSLQIHDLDRSNLKRIDELTKGTFVVIVETKNKENNGENAFEVLGFDAGLRVVDLQRDYNKTSVKITLATHPQVKEPKMVYKWLETDYRNTLERFENRLNSQKRIKYFDQTFDNTFE